ncbi:hypothetical protein Mp_1g16600 [Marchantia polymorpha subsp. ruderalis]|uniref:Domain X domain-containing protein n=2 Tax=Marchantia polymorpha TaxID=3197 RepID=A0AAF6AQW5_MARPO|nr:hypothetical protein MARPO_0001s0001 [Marchantia polymorpha]BBM98835.1 hypothetical protein Mp_1g16600 [Marchantia polymorpha subsp. ruderalis]|eukprot:PTQ49912.1 hypothetical protein MARPO_0001s0001 [Marchantia polymorpha]
MKGRGGRRCFYDIQHLLRIIYILRYSAINTVARKLGLNTAKVIKRFGMDLIFRDHTNEIKHKLNFPRSLANKRMNFHWKKSS